MDILNNEPTGRPSTPDPQCSICLNELTNKCYTNACVHLFCFDCLQWWTNTCLQRCSRSQPTCPLCKQTFRFIYHSFDELGAFETYTVPIQPGPDEQERSYINRIIVQDILNDMEPSIFQRNPLLRRSEYGLNEVGNRLSLYHQPGFNYAITNESFAISGQRTRIQVYVDNVWARPLPNTDGRFRNGTIIFYRNNPADIHRLRTFVLRDVVAIREAVRLEGHPRAQSQPFPINPDFYMTNLIMSNLQNCEIKQLHLINNLRDFLNVHGEHFSHELYNFALSVFEIDEYDNNVQYTHPLNELNGSLFVGPPVPRLLLTHDEELQRPNIIEESSSTNNSDVEIISVTFRSTDPLNSASINQPSTSTGIRDSLDRPNDEELQRPNIIEESSSTNNSDVEIISVSFHSTDSLNSASINQPSTSTGIRDSLDRPNTNNRRRIIFSLTINDSSSFQSVNGGVSQVSYSSQVKRPNSDESDDEELIIVTQGSQTANLRSRDVNNKKKKKH